MELARKTYRDLEIEESGYNDEMSEDGGMEKGTKGDTRVMFGSGDPIQDAKDNPNLDINMYGNRQTQMEKKINYDRTRKYLPIHFIQMDFEKHGVYCWTYILSRLEIKQRPRLLFMLEFMAAVIPTKIMLRLFEESKKTLLLYPKQTLDRICIGNYGFMCVCFV